MREHGENRITGHGARAALAALAMLALAGAGSAARAQGSYDAPDAPVALDQLLPESLIASGQHRVTGVRRVGPTRVEFDIESEAAGMQRATSIPLAVIRIQEVTTLVQATNQFAQDNRELADEMRGQIRIGGDSVVDIIGSPLDTSARVVGQFGRNVGQTFEEFGEFRGPGQAGAAAPGTPAVDPILASHRRSVAGQLNLDVYSTNPSVQRFLDAMARARGAGQGRAGITTVSLARPAEISVDGGRLLERVRSSVLNEEQGRLFEHDRTLLTDAGVEASLAERLLAHPVLTPTHKSSLTEYVAFMRGVDGRGALVEAALDARDEVDALGKVQLARMYAHYHESVKPLRTLVGAGHLALAVDRDGALLIALPFDILDWSEDSQRVFTGLAEFATRKKASARVVLLGGAATPRAAAALGERGFTLEQRFLFRR